MSKLQWGLPGSKTYESGIDRGVLYLPTGEALPWNGLTSLEEDAMAAGTPLYFEGVKYFDDVTREDFAGTLKAYTYPDAFLELEGVTSLYEGLSVGGQPRKKFNLSYRTQKSNDLTTNAGHKIHILYNLIATPENVEWATESDNITINEFGWKLSSSPEHIPGFAPTAHAIIDTSLMRPELLAELEELLYGTDAAEPALPALSDLVAYSTDWSLIAIIDNGDGTWTASTNYPGLIVDNGDGTFEINEATAYYLNSDQYIIDDTRA